MSKERELLKEIMSYFAKGDITIRRFENSSDVAETLHTAQELLAQPETEQEPVEDRIVGNGEPPTTDGDPDVYTSSPMTHREAYLRGYEKAVCALKREPLSDEEVIAKYRAITLYAPSYYAGFRDAEKAHGIGGGE